MFLAGSGKTTLLRALAAKTGGLKVNYHGYRPQEHLLTYPIMGKSTRSQAGLHSQGCVAVFTDSMQ